MLSRLQRIRRIKLHTYHIIILLMLALTLGSIGVGILVQTNPLIKVFDTYFYDILSRNFQNSFLDWLIVPFNYNFIQWAGPMPSYMYVMVFSALVYLIIFNRSQIIWFILAIIAGSILAYIITALDWQFVFRSRPFLNLPNDVDSVGRQAWEKLSSFPSGHARETALYSTIIAYFIPWLKWMAIIFIIFIAFSRVYLGAHYPTDAIAGALIGFLAAKTVLLITEELKAIKRLNFRRKDFKKNEV